MGSKVSNLAKSLAKAFKLSFTVSDSNQQVLKSVLRFVAEHLYSKVRNCLEVSSMMSVLDISSCLPLFKIKINSKLNPD